MNYAVMEKTAFRTRRKYHQYAFSRWVKCLGTHYDTIVASIVIPFEEKMAL